MEKIKDYETAIKPADIVYTAIKRLALAEDLRSSTTPLYTHNKGDLSQVTDNDLILNTAIDISNTKYRLDHPYITDLCSMLYTVITTQVGTVIRDLAFIKGNARFLISKDHILKLALGSIVDSNNHTITGGDRVRKTVVDTLMPILNRKRLPPEHIITINNFKLSDGSVKNFILKSAPLHVMGEIRDTDTGETYYEIELSGMFYPVQTKQGKLTANTRYLHTVPNLSVVLDIGEDLYIQSAEYKGNSIKSEIARRFIDLLQLSYNQHHNLPCTCGTVVDDTYKLEVWGDTLRSLYPKSFRGRTRKGEFIGVAELASKYFHLGIEFVGKSEVVKTNEYLLIPASDNFCTFNHDRAIFTATIS